jgi:hypothetical protein
MKPHWHELALTVLVAAALSPTARATEVQGDVLGEWDALGSPYVVTADINVPAGEMLEIQPGVTVQFAGSFFFFVYGILQAVGTVTDSIYFTTDVDSNPDQWRGIRILNAPDTSRFAYCVVEYVHYFVPDPDDGGWGLRIENCSPLIEHCSIRYNYGRPNGGGIATINSNCRISDSDILFNYGEYGGGLELGWGGDILVIRCLVAYNTASQGAGLAFWGVNPTVINCTIVGNHGDDASGLRCTAGSVPEIRNCIFASNNGGPAVGLYGVPNPPTIEYSCFWDHGSLFGGNPELPGFGETTEINANGDPCDVYFNIFLDPSFVNPEEGDFHLSDDSPCLDAGDPESPEDPDGSVADMGAYSGQGGGPQFCVLYPNGGELWSVLRNDTVRWLAEGVTGSIRIELNRDYPGGDWEMLSASTPNDGEQVFVISEPMSDWCRVRISTLDNSHRDISNHNFRIGSQQGYLALVQGDSAGQPVLSWDAGVVECPAGAVAVFRFANFGEQSLTVSVPEEPPSVEFMRTTDCPISFVLGPHAVSPYQITLQFDPSADSLYRDTLLIPSDAVNAVSGSVRIPLSGQQVSTPQAPNIRVFPEGEDARLMWQAVSQSVGGCPVTVTRYLVFYCGVYDGPFYYHGFSTTTTYTHFGVLRHSPAMFYLVVAYTGPVGLVDDLPGGGGLAMDQVLSRLQQKR